MTSDTEKRLVQGNSLDRKLVLSPSERCLSEREFSDLIALADSLKQFDEKKRAVLDAVGERDDGNFPISVAYEVAQSLGIPADYMDRAIALKYPSVQQQFANIQEHGADPSFDAVINTYGKVLLNSLTSLLPQDTFDLAVRNGEAWNSNGDGIVGIYQRRETTRFERKYLFWERKRVEIERNKLVELNFYSSRYEGIPSGKFMLHVQVKNPLFLRACGDSLRELNQHFVRYLKHPKMFYHYVVE